jgi:hypothetical protein
MTTTGEPPEAPDILGFLRFVEGDDLSMVVRCHLALEAALNAIMEMSVPGASSDLDRLPFMAKFHFCAGLGKMRAASPDVWSFANRLRNRFAHRLDAQITDQDVSEFASVLPLHWQEAFRIMKRSLPEPPRYRVAICYAFLFLEALVAANLADAAVARYVIDFKTRRGTG